MKLNVEEKVSAKIIMPDMTIDVTFLDDRLITVGPVRTTLGTDAAPAGTVIMPMQVAEHLERITEAIRTVRKGRGDYRTVCPIHGYQPDSVYHCVPCAEAEAEEKAEKGPASPPAPAPVAF